MSRTESIHEPLPALAEAMFKNGLSLTRLRGLLCLARHGGAVNARCMSQELGLTSAGITTLADVLESRGLCTRVRAEDDRRQVVIALTDPGQRLLMELHASIAEAAPSGPRRPQSLNHPA